MRNSDGTLTQERIVHLRTRLQQAAPRLWAEIEPDAGPMVYEIEDTRSVRLAVMAELVLDADRLVSAGHMTPEEYKDLLSLDYDLVEKWASEALRHYAD